MMEKILIRPLIAFGILIAVSLIGAVIGIITLYIIRRYKGKYLGDIDK